MQNLNFHVRKKKRNNRFGILTILLLMTAELWFSLTHSMLTFFLYSYWLCLWTLAQILPMRFLTFVDNDEMSVCGYPDVLLFPPKVVVINCPVLLVLVF